MFEVGPVLWLQSLASGPLTKLMVAVSALGYAPFYVGLVVAFESLIGIIQPANDSTLVITTFDADGTSHDRVLSRLESEGRLYVAANLPRSRMIVTSQSASRRIKGNSCSNSG